MNARALLLLLPVLLLAIPSAGATPTTHYTPQTGDEFHYYETTVVNNGQGNDYGYVNSSFINGSISIINASPNGTDNTSYQSNTHWFDNQGDSGNLPSQGTFTFSGTTLHYLQGTDNQTGDNGTPVWFLVSTSLPRGASFYLLTTPFSIVSTNTSFPYSGSSTGYVSTIFAEGNGSYGYVVSAVDWQATYNWKMYFDPTTGYVVGYVYTEQDSDTQGDSFTYTDTLTVTTTSYPLTATSAPPPPPASASSNSDAELVGVVVLVLLVVVVVAVVLLLRSRRDRPLPRHSASGSVSFGSPPGTPPPPISLIPSQQPAVQQVILRETVKVNCKYCGALIDSTVTNCPNCGASRS
ncbi:MAG: zinc ribbon domain-containing protein [Thermoplasmata archaeon]|nr:zinc ribbon domain-containing protein [Thermoplasmata archaeon]